MNQLVFSVLALLAVNVIAQDLDCGPPPPVAPPDVDTACATCPSTCPEGQICCPLGCAGGSECRTPFNNTCPIDRPSQPCSNAACENESCPKFPEATCVVDSCGSCNAVFSDPQVGGVIPKFACPLNSMWPECLTFTTCLRDTPVNCSNGCPTIPDAVCNRDCNCSLFFTDPRNGNIYSDEECGRTTSTAMECPSDRPLQECDASPCSIESCPRFPNAICRDDYCGGCNAVFTRPEDGSVIPKFACPVTSNWPQCLAVILCFANASINCNNGCPELPNAVCNTSCDCSPVFTDNRTGNVFSSEECGSVVPEPSCPPLSNLDLVANCTDGDNVGSRCSIYCPVGHLRRSGPTRVRCRRNQQWIPPPGFLRCRRGFNNRCPPSSNATLGICSQCQVPCPGRQTCCPTSCPGGSTCTTLPEFTCRPLSNTSVLANCSNGNRVGSRCSVYCPSGQTRIRGPSRTQCFERLGWYPRPAYLRCASVVNPSSSIGCRKIPIRNMRYNCVRLPGFRSGVCFLSCRSGYRLRGVRITRCLRTGIRIRLFPSPIRNACVISRRDLKFYRIVSRRRFP